MTISSQQIADRVYRITLSGLLTWAEFQNFLAQAETENVFATGKVKLLLLLEEFTGWEAGEQWSDVSFFSNSRSLFLGLLFSRSPRDFKRCQIKRQNLPQALEDASLNIRKSTLSFRLKKENTPTDLRETM